METVASPPQRTSPVREFSYVLSECLQAIHFQNNSQVARFGGFGFCHEGTVGLVLGNLRDLHRDLGRPSGPEPEFGRSGGDVTQHGPSEQIDFVLLEESLQFGVFPVLGNGPIQIPTLENFLEEIGLDRTDDWILCWGDDTPADENLESEYECVTQFSLAELIKGVELNKRTRNRLQHR